MSKLKIGDKVQFKSGTSRDGETWTVDVSCRQRHTMAISTADMKDGLVRGIEPVTSVEDNIAVVWPCGCVAIHRDYYLEVVSNALSQSTSELRKSRYGRCEHSKCQDSRMTSVSLVDKVYYCSFHAERARGESGVK